MFSQKNSFIKDISKVFSSNILVLFLSFLSEILIARNLGLEGKGLFTLLLVYPKIITTISQMGIRQASIYEIGRKKFEHDKIVGNIISFFMFSSIIGTFVCYLLINNFSKHDFSFWLIIIASATIPLNLIKEYSSGILIGKKKIGLSTILNWLPQLLKFFGLIFLVVILNMYVSGAIFATFFSIVSAAVISIYLINANIKIRPKIDLKILKSMISLGSVYALSMFMNSLNYRIDVILLEQFSNSSEIGLYSVGVNFSELVLQIPSAVGIVIFSRSSNSKDPKKFSELTIKVLKLGLLISIITAVFIVLIAPYAIPILYSNIFKDSVIIIQLLMPGIIALVVYKILGFDMAGKGKPWASVIASFPGILVNIGLNILLIPKFGGKGAAIASSISYSIMALMHWILFRRILSSYKV